MEHVDKEPGTIGDLSQRLLRRPWRRLGDGCDLLPGTADAIDQAGFSTVETTLRNIGPALDPTARTLWGTAIK